MKTVSLYFILKPEKTSKPVFRMIWTECASMPAYDYFCEANQQTVEVTHPADIRLETWIALCYAAQIDVGDTDPAAPVRRVIKKAPGVAVQTFNSELKNMGFTKLIKRDEGVYENVTALDTEKKYMERGDKGSLPDIKKKVGD